MRTVPGSGSDGARNPVAMVPGHIDISMKACFLGEGVPDSSLQWEATVRCVLHFLGLRQRPRGRPGRAGTVVIALAGAVLAAAASGTTAAARPSQSPAADPAGRYEVS